MGLLLKGTVSVEAAGAIGMCVTHSAFLLSLGRCNGDIEQTAHVHQREEEVVPISYHVVLKLQQSLCHRSGEIALGE